MLMIKGSLLRAVAILFLLWPVCSFSQEKLNLAQKITLSDDWYVQQSGKVKSGGKELSNGILNLKTGSGQNPIHNYGSSHNERAI